MSVKSYEVKHSCFTFLLCSVQSVLSLLCLEYVHAVPYPGVFLGGGHWGKEGAVASPLASWVSSSFVNFDRGLSLRRRCQKPPPPDTHLLVQGGSRQGIQDNGALPLSPAVSQPVPPPTPLHHQLGSLAFAGPLHAAQFQASCGQLGWVAGPHAGLHLEPSSPNGSSTLCPPQRPHPGGRSCSWHCTARHLQQELWTGLSVAATAQPGYDFSHRAV